MHSIESPGARSAKRKPPRYEEISTGGRARWIGMAMLLAGAGAGVVLFLYNPAKYSFYPVCYFHETTGLLCPGCGSLRATHQLLRGHLRAALRLNALFVFSLPPALWWMARYVLARLRNRPFALTLRPAWLWWGLGLMLAFGVLRNLPFAHAAWLAP